MTVNAGKKAMNDAIKRKIRAWKRYRIIMNKLKSLPGVKNVKVNVNYVNPVTLEAPPLGIVVYHVKDSQTGRVDLYDKVTFWKLLHKYSPNIKNNYNLLMAPAGRTLFPNPTTRSGVTTRNIQRVRARPKPKTPSPTSAATKIKNALRKKVAAKKVAAKRKTPSPAKKPSPKRKTPSPAKKNNTRKSH
jgi:hypothetical protein